MAQRLTPLVAVVTLPLAMLALLFGEFTLAAVIVVVGWFLLTPATAILLGEEHAPVTTDEDSERAGTQQDPIEELRDRYARGELTDAEFEERVERLLETEDVDTGSDPNAVAWSRDAPDGGDTDREREPESGVE